MKELKNFAKIYWDLGLNIACSKNEITEFNSNSQFSQLK